MRSPNNRRKCEDSFMRKRNFPHNARNIMRPRILQLVPDANLIVYMDIVCAIMDWPDTSIALRNGSHDRNKNFAFGKFRSQNTQNMRPKFSSSRNSSSSFSLYSFCLELGLVQAPLQTQPTFEQLDASRNTRSTCSLYWQLLSRIKSSKR